MRENPYPGLRPFRRDEAHLFFGRDEQTDQLLDKLARTRFITVTGLSGSGKSSLVQAGLLPNLEYGYLTDAGANWNILTMRPGIAPIQNLAQAMLDAKLSPALSPSGTLSENTCHCEESATKQSPEPGEIASQSLAMTSPPIKDDQSRVHGLTQRLSSGGHLEFAEMLKETLPEGQHRSFLLVVDQFEELFRYENLSRLEERKFFVELLLISAKQQDVPIYVVITIRSDWLGQCAVFQGLPEMINAGQFLTPRLTQEQMRLSITAPALVVGGTIDDRLALRLLQDSDLNSDQLPVVQHCLMRMWALKTGIVAKTTPIVLTLADYENPRINRLAQALSQHADEAYTELQDEWRKKIAERLFRCLTESDLRRPARITDIAAVVGTSAAEVIAVADVFRQADRCFLNPSGDTPLKPETVLDISHESLIRNWKKLSNWAEQEAESARTYRRLEETACLWKQKQAALWSSPDLESVLAWKEKEKRTPAWAKRYGAHFELAMQFLDESRKKNMIRKVVSFSSIIVVIIAILAIFLALLAFQQTQLAQSSSQIATLKHQEALKASRSADEQKQRAESSERGERIARQEAEYQVIADRSAELSAQAQLAMLENYPQRGLLLAVEAVNTTLKRGRANLPIAEESLRQALTKIGGKCFAKQEGTIFASYISPDGRWRVTVTQENQTAWIWDMATTETSFTPIFLTDHVSIKKSVVISADSYWLAVGLDDGSVQLWDLRGIEPKKSSSALQGHTRRINTVSISSDNRWLATGSEDGTVRLWDITTFKSIDPPIVLDNNLLDDIERLPTDISISPDNQWLAISNKDNTLELWKVSDDEPPTFTQVNLGELNHNIKMAQISPDSHWLVAGGNDGILRLWDLKNETESGIPCVLLHGHDGAIQSMAISADASFIATGGMDATIRLWKLPSEGVPSSGDIVLRGGEKEIPDVVAITPDNHWLFSDSRSSVARLWDLTSRDASGSRNSLLLSESEDGLVPFGISSDSRWLVTAYSNGTIRLWNLKMGNPLSNSMTLYGHERKTYKVQISPDSQNLISDSYDGISRLWDLTVSGALAFPIVLQGKEDTYPVMITPDQHWMITGEKNNAHVWNLQVVNPAKESRLFQGHTDQITHFFMSTNNRWLLTVSQDNTLLAWDLAPKTIGDSYALLQDNTSRITALANSSDARWLGVGHENGVLRLFELASEDIFATPIMLNGEPKAIRQIAISPDSRWIAAYTSNNILQLWDRFREDPGKASITLEWSPDNNLSMITISPDSRWLIAGYEKGNIGRWDLKDPKPGETKAELQGHAGRIALIEMPASSRWLITGNVGVKEERAGFQAFFPMLAGKEENILIQEGVIRLSEMHADPMRANSSIILCKTGENVSTLVSADSHWFVTKIDGTVHLWDLFADNPGKHPLILNKEGELVSSMAISPDSHWLVTANVTTQL